MQEREEMKKTSDKERRRDHKEKEKMHISFFKEMLLACSKLGRKSNRTATVRNTQLFAQSPKGTSKVLPVLSDEEAVLGRTPRHFPTNEVEVLGANLKINVRIPSQHPTELQATEERL